MISYLRNSVLMIIDYTKIPNNSFVYKVYVFIATIVDYILSLFAKDRLNTYSHIYKDELGNPFLEITISDYSVKPISITKFLELLMKNRFSKGRYFQVITIEKNTDEISNLVFLQDAKLTLKAYFKYLSLIDTNYQIVSHSELNGLIKNVISDISKVESFNKIYFSIEELSKDTILVGACYMLGDDKKMFLLKCKQLD